MTDPDWPPTKQADRLRVALEMVRTIAAMDNAAPRQVEARVLRVALRFAERPDPLRISQEAFWGQSVLLMREVQRQMQARGSHGNGAGLN
jgi:hypothetical protein